VCAQPHIESDPPPHYTAQRPGLWRGRRELTMIIVSLGVLRAEPAQVQASANERFAREAE